MEHSGAAQAIMVKIMGWGGSKFVENILQIIVLHMLIGLITRGTILLILLTNKQIMGCVGKRENDYKMDV